MRKAIPFFAPLAAQQSAFTDPPKAHNGRFINADGMTIYTLDKDTTPGGSARTGSCMSNWPTATANPTDNPSGDWTLIRNADGKQQWAYKGHPLYRYAADKQAGEMKGGGFKDMWHTAKP